MSEVRCTCKELEDTKSVIEAISKTEFPIAAVNIPPCRIHNSEAGEIIVSDEHNQTGGNDES